MKRTLPIASIDIPEDWEDRSTYHYVSPPVVELKTKQEGLSAGHKLNVVSPRNSIIVSRTVIAPGKTLEATLKEEENQLRQSLPSFKILSRTPWNHPKYGKLMAFETSFEVAPGSVVHQIRIFFPGKKSDSGDPGICVTLSCDARHYEKQKPKLEAMVQSIELA